MYDCRWGVAASGVSRGVKGKVSESECNEIHSVGWKNTRFGEGQSCSDKI